MNEQKPIIVFPKPDKYESTKRNPVPPRFHFPDHKSQGKILKAKFKDLKDKFKKRVLEIQQTQSGIDPDLTLVIEIIGSVDSFIKSVDQLKVNENLSAFDWLGELEISGIEPDENFYFENEDKREKQLDGRLYLLSTNQKDLRKVLSLWNKIRKDKENMDFRREYRGLAPFKNVFAKIKDIRLWGVADRLEGTGILSYWMEKLEEEGDDLIPVEIELWYKNDEEKRNLNESNVSEHISSIGGEVLKTYTFEDIKYHVLLAKLPPKEVDIIIKKPETELVKHDSIMFFHPISQFATPELTVKGDEENIIDENIDLPDEEPVVALLDGMPLSTHQALMNRVRVDDPETYETDYLAHQRIHGTAMASLIIHGDINGKLKPIKSTLYIRPILKSQSTLDSKFVETIPENVSSLDLIERAVRRIFEGEAGEDPAAPSIRVINLSIGDSTRPFTISMSPFARLIDYLSDKYNVLFIISAGNQGSIDLNEHISDMSQVSDSDLQNSVVRTLFSDIHNRKILSPSESINALTVGAHHKDNSSYQRNSYRINPFFDSLPSPISSFGNGYQRSVKPEIIYSGGRQLYYEHPATNVIIPSPSDRKPGIKVATPGVQAGQRNSYIHTCGTSNSAASVSHNAAQCHEYLQEILENQASEVDYQPYITPLLKAMLVHSASWDDSFDIFSNIFSLKDPKTVKTLYSKWVGYGSPNFDKVLGCGNERATLIGFGELFDKNADRYKLPLPPSLGLQSVWRRLTVTLAWLSPVRVEVQKYRKAHLWYDFGSKNTAIDLNKALNVSRNSVDMYHSIRGTLQHGVFEGNLANEIIDGDELLIKVNCREDAGKIDKPILYGLFVSLEVKQEVNIAIYDEVRTRIQPRVIITPKR